MSSNPKVSTPIAVIGLFVVAFFLSGSTTNPADVYLPQLKNSDPDTRIAALRELLTSLDSRIPEAMLPLLSDEGNSIRRVAARAIGSRWWQIPKDKSDVYAKALQGNLKSEQDFEDEKNMAERAIGLLTKRYDSKMFSKSPNRRWIIYERYGLPCLIDTTTYTEELLGWPRTKNGGIEMLVGTFGNVAFGDDDMVWHPSKEAVGFSVLESRRDSTVWIWEHKVGLQKLLQPELIRLLQGKGRHEEPFSTDATIKGWKGDELQVSIESGREGEGSAMIGWDISKHKWRVISREKHKQSE